MRFVSTRGGGPPVSFRRAVMDGLAADGGLYLPAGYPALSAQTLAKMPAASLGEIAFSVARPFLDDELSDRRLRALCEETCDFAVPIVPVSKRSYALELFHGPSLAFKDFGARFMARLVSFWMASEDRELTILAATSGDTGGAVAAGFYGLAGVRVVILYPLGKISRLQELQIASLGGNVRAVGVSGTFDDCQRLVKSAFADRELRRSVRISTANSINLARLIPQSFYYFFAWSRLQERHDPLLFSVPSGNFGNLTAGALAHRMGMPCAGFVAATNANDVVPRYLAGGEFLPRPSVETISNAMDVGDPSNFERLLSIFGGDETALRRRMVGKSYTDRQTLEAISGLKSESGYLLDPHGAVAYLGLRELLQELGGGQAGVFLETAHPAKFPEAILKAIGRPPQMPERLSRLLGRRVEKEPISSNYQDLREVLLA